MISVLISSGARYKVDREKLRKKVEAFLTGRGLDDVEVSIAIVGGRKIRQLNRTYRKIDAATDVLSFPLEEPRDKEGVLRLGDIVICYSKAREGAAEEEKFVDDKISDLIEHGLRHLLGEHHD